MAMAFFLAILPKAIIELSRGPDIATLPTNFAADVLAFKSVAGLEFLVPKAMPPIVQPCALIDSSRPICYDAPTAPPHLVVELANVRRVLVLFHGKIVTQPDFYPIKKLWMHRLVAEILCLFVGVQLVFGLSFLLLFSLGSVELINILVCVGLLSQQILLELSTVLWLLKELIRYTVFLLLQGGMFLLPRSQFLQVVSLTCATTRCII